MFLELESTTKRSALNEENELSVEIAFSQSTARCQESPMTTTLLGEIWGRDLMRDDVRAEVKR